MEMIIFIGIQATGKSSFYRDRFFRSHVRINLDMLKTRHREKILLAACLDGKTPFVVDNTNLTREDRACYIVAAKEKKFTVHGYFFQSRLAESLARNATREGDERLPDVAIRSATGRLELPSMAEGFDRLSFVRLDDQNQFFLEEWKHEI